ncbi:unnamed protein product [Prunus armeniaca]
MEVLADSRGPGLVRGLLDEPEPCVLEWERLLPSVQLGFLHVLVFQLSDDRVLLVWPCQSWWRSIREV